MVMECTTIEKKLLIHLIMITFTNDIHNEMDRSRVMIYRSSVSYIAYFFLLDVRLKSAKMVHFI